MPLDIPAYRLQNQRLTQNKLDDPAAVVEWLGAVQSQDYAGAKWAIGLRTNGLTEPDLDRAFADGSILRTHLLRPTWHFVTPADIRWMLALTGPRVHQANASMYRNLELDAAILKRSRSVLEKMLRDNHQRTRLELIAALNEAGISTDDLLRGTYIIMHAELDGLICSGARRGKQFTYALLEERAPQVKALTRDESLAELVTRYFQSHAPATLRDFCVWSGLTMADARNGIESVKSKFISEAINGQIYWFADTKWSPKRKEPAAFLLPNYDEYFIGFKDRSAIGVVAQGAGIKGDDPSLLANILILDGQIVGGWRRTLKKNEVLVVASLIIKLTKAEERAVADAVEQFGTFLELPVSLTFKEHTDGQRKTRSL
jgi:winged helix DNA-binding protein